MKLLKLLIQSAPAAILFAVLLGLLLFYVNPATGLGAGSLARVVAPLSVVHAPVLWLLWPVALLALRFFAERPLELDWFRFEVFHRFHLMNTAVGAAIWWGSYLATGALLPAPARRLLLAGCGMITLVWALGALLSLQRVMFRTPRPRLAQGILVVVLYGGLFGLRVGGGGGLPRETGPLRPGTARAPGQVLLVAVEGLSPEFVLPLVAEGRLPGLSAMMRDGARARVRSFAPPLPPAAWTTVATGTLPSRHGIVDRSRWLFPALPGTVELDLAPRFLGFSQLASLGLVERQPLSSKQRRKPALWSILDAARLRSSVIGWPATDPPEAIRGEVLPPSWLAEGRVDPAAVEEELARLAEWGSDAEGERLEQAARRALRLDLAALLAARESLQVQSSAATLVYLPGLGRIQQRFLGKAVPPSLRWRPGPRDPVYGEVISRYYRFLDEAIVRLGPGNPRGDDRLRGAADHEPMLTIVMSAAGLKRPAPWTLFLGRLGRWRWLGPLGRPPAGMLLVAGPGVVSGAEVGSMAPEDLLPTLAYYLGLPVARDLAGRPRTDLFDEEFASDRPLAYIPSYRRPEPP